jgi:hypothetical protein
MVGEMKAKRRKDIETTTMINIVADYTTSGITI